MDGQAGPLPTAEEYERGLVIQVSDNGKGISAQALRHVFDSFFREDSARTSSVQAAAWGWPSAGALWTATTARFG